MLLYRVKSFMQNTSDTILIASHLNKIDVDNHYLTYYFKVLNHYFKKMFFHQILFRKKIISIFLKIIISKNFYKLELDFFISALSLG